MCQEEVILVGLLKAVTLNISQIDFITLLIPVMNSIAELPNSELLIELFNIGKEIGKLKASNYKELFNLRPEIQNKNLKYISTAKMKITAHGGSTNIKSLIAKS